MNNVDCDLSNNQRCRYKENAENPLKSRPCKQ